MSEEKRDDNVSGCKFARTFPVVVEEQIKKGGKEGILNSGQLSQGKGRCTKRLKAKKGLVQ